MILNFNKANWTNLIIYKCGYSTLNKIADKYICYPKDNEYLNKTFIVFRDPFERVVSVYKDICLSDTTGHQNQKEKGLYKNIPIKEFLNIIFKTFDWHFIPQTQTHEFGNHKIDTIVMLSDLPNFIKNELQIKDFKIENSTKKIQFDKSLFEPYRKYIEEFYKDDYDFLENNKNIIYKEDVNI